MQRDVQRREQMVDGLLAAVDVGAMPEILGVDHAAGVGVSGGRASGHGQRDTQ